MPESVSHAGAWAVSMIMIVVVSWIFYRYFAPKSWREWAGAGLVQAFIIALYAEMYGFPLTIYVLTGFFGIEIPWLHVSGHLWATLLGYGMIGAVIEMIIGFTFVVLGLYLLIEGWREVYRASREGRLVTDFCAGCAHERRCGEGIYGVRVGVDVAELADVRVGERRPRHLDGLEQAGRAVGQQHVVRVERQDVRRVGLFEAAVAGARQAGVVDVREHDQPVEPVGVLLGPRGDHRERVVGRGVGHRLCGVERAPDAAGAGDRHRGDDAVLLAAGQRIRAARSIPPATAARPHAE